MAKILFVDYDSPGVFAVFEDEKKIEQDTLKLCFNETADLFRYNERGGGVYERAEVKDGAEEEEDEADYQIDCWTPVNG